MFKWFYSSVDTVPYILIGTLIVYCGVIVLTRILGKRSFSKMSSFDFAITIAIGSLIASTIVSSSVSLVQGLVALFAVFSIQYIVAFFRRWSFFSKLVDNQPMLLMKEGQVLWDNLKKSKVTESDLRAKLREANVHQLSEVSAVVLETTGDVSVLHTSSDRSVDDWILSGVVE